MPTFEYPPLISVEQQNCSHRWDGPILTSEDGLLETATCSLCHVMDLDETLTALDHAEDSLSS